MLWYASIEMSQMARKIARYTMQQSTIKLSLVAVYQIKVGMYCTVACWGGTPEKKNEGQLVEVGAAVVVVCNGT